MSSYFVFWWSEQHSNPLICDLRLTVTDLLDQNKRINRTVTETYVEDTQNQALGRYLMLTFTYTVR